MWLRIGLVVFRTAQFIMTNHVHKQQEQNTCDSMGLIGSRYAPEPTGHLNREETDQQKARLLVTIYFPTVKAAQGARTLLCVISKFNLTRDVPIYSKKVAKASLSHTVSQSTGVTKSPNHWWENSWVTVATTSSSREILVWVGSAKR